MIGWVVRLKHMEASSTSSMSWWKNWCKIHARIYLTIIPVDRIWITVRPNYFKSIILKEREVLVLISWRLKNCVWIAKYFYLLQLILFVVLTFFTQWLQAIMKIFHILLSLSHPMWEFKYLFNFKKLCLTVFQKYKMIWIIMGYKIIISTVIVRSSPSHVSSFLRNLKTVLRWYWYPKIIL